MKKILVALTIILVMILSTGCQAEPKETRSIDPEATLPSIGISIPEIIPTEEETTEDFTEPSIEETTAAETIEETTIVETQPELTTEEETEPPITTAEETTPPPTTMQEETTIVEETTEAPKPKYTFEEYEGFSMYATATVNIRTLPSTEGEIVTTRHINEEIWVTGRCKETGWYRIDIEGQTFYITYLYVSKEKVVIQKTAPTQQSSSYNPAVKSASGFIYYAVAGKYPNRDYEQYLYNCLNDRGIVWWYPYAVAQIWQESCWNPKSTNGRDHGICQFKGIYFQSRAANYANFPDADIWNPYHSLYVYSFYMKAILASCNNKVDAALSYYIRGDWNGWDQTYIDHVMGWYRQLQAQ